VRWLATCLAKGRASAGGRYRWLPCPDSSVEPRQRLGEVVGGCVGGVRRCAGARGGVRWGTGGVRWGMGGVVSPQCFCLYLG
jgi:hypothetical protein